MTHDRPEDYERELARDRAEIGETIEAIQHRLSPGQLLDQALGYVRTNGGEAVGSVMRSARQNPWPLLLTGIGLAWLMTSTTAHVRRGNGYSETYGTDYDRGYGTAYGDHAVNLQRATSPDYPDYDDDAQQEYRAHRSTLERVRAAAASVTRQVGETEESFAQRVVEAKARALDITQQAGESVDALRERVEAAVGRARDAAAGLASRAADAWERGRDAVGAGGRRVRESVRQAGDRAVDLYQAEPLIAGAIGIAAGALIGALLPSTALEDRMLGDQGRRLRRSATDLAANAAERAEAAASEGVRAAAEAVDTSVRGDDRSPTAVTH